jgi:hypothetical protein
VEARAAGSSGSRHDSDLTDATQLLYAFGAKGWSGFTWQILIGAVFLLGGFTLLTNPVAGLISLTLVIIATFLASGVLKILIGFRLRPMDGWGWFMLLGLLSLAVGVLIWNQLPSSAAWSLVLVGIDFLSTGLVFIRFGHLWRAGPPELSARRLDPGPLEGSSKSWPAGVLPRLILSDVPAGPFPPWPLDPNDWWEWDSWFGPKAKERLWSR